MRPDLLTRRHYAVARVGLACWAAFSGLNAQAATVHADGTVGVTWTGKDISGSPIAMKLVKGVQENQG